MLTGYFPQAGFNPSLTPNNQRPAHRLDHRPQARAARLGAALRLPAEDAPQRRPGLPRRRRRPVRHRRRPERPELRRARRRAAAGPRRRPPRRPQRPARAASTASSRPPRPQANRARPDGQRLPAEGVRPDDLAGGQEGVRHPRRAGQAARRVRPQLARPVVPDGPPAGRGRRPLRDHRPQQLGHARRQLRHAQEARCCPRSTRRCRRCSATWPTAACSTRRWWSSPASSAARRASTRTPAATTGGRRSPSPWAAAASRAAASSARPTPAPSSPPSDPLRPRRPRRHDLPPAGHRPRRTSSITPEGRPVADRQQRPRDPRLAVTDCRPSFSGKRCTPSDYTAGRACRK